MIIYRVKKKKKDKRRMIRAVLLVGWYSLETVVSLWDGTALKLSSACGMVQP